MDESSPPPEEPSFTTKLDSASADNPPPPSTTEQDHSGPDRAAKRRKKCPESLDKIQKSGLPPRTHSFTFDTKFSASPPDSTPKFGSFKIPPAEAEPEKEQETTAEAADEEEAAAEEEFEDAVKLVSGLVTVNGIAENN